MTEVPTIRQHHWAPFQPMMEVVERSALGKKNVLEVGPGHIPFGPATEFVDWRTWPQLEGKRVHALNINQDRLPLGDKSFEYVYCRHTVEDLYNPLLICGEMERVGKAGYIETPSPIAECARGVDYSSPAWRGYHHHRHLVWAEGDTLMLLPKYPIIEHVDLKEIETELARCLNAHPLYWNNYFFWEGTFRTQLLEHDKDFKIQSNYIDFVVRAIKQSYEQTQQIAARFFPQILSATQAG
jgi:hypothetical protein